MLFSLGPVWPRRSGAHQNGCVEKRHRIGVETIHRLESIQCPWIKALFLKFTATNCDSARLCFEWKLTACFSLFKKSFIWIKKNSLKEKPTLASLSAKCLLLSGFLFANFVWLDIWLLSSLCHQLIWKKKLNSRSGKAICTVWKMVKTPWGDSFLPKLTVRSFCDFFLFQIKPRCRLSKSNITLGCCWFYLHML